MDELDEEYHVMFVINEYRNHRHHQSSAFVLISYSFVLDCHFDLDHNHIYVGDGINNTTSSGWWGD